MDVEYEEKNASLSLTQVGQSPSNGCGISFFEPLLSQISSIFKMLTKKDHNFTCTLYLRKNSII